MSLISGAIIGLAYMLGLLTSNLLGQVYGVPIAGIASLAIGLGAAIVWPRNWRKWVKPESLLFAGFLGFFGAVYLQFRLPQPDTNDVSYYAPDIQEKPALVAVRGRVITTPKLTRSGKVSFLFHAEQISELFDQSDVDTVTIATVASTGQNTQGRLYTTLPLLQGTGLYPGQSLVAIGNLYRPKTATNPGGFDFQAYLFRQGTFAGLSAQRSLLTDNQPAWGWWQIRRRIIRSQAEGLGSPAGPLVSSMVLGGRVVDLPPDVRDRFAGLGLAHTLAASGFHVSLVLGLVLALARNLSPRQQATIGAGALLLFLGMTGIQPSVLRAVIMGGGALIALAQERKVKPLGTLILAACLLLLFNPLWIWDLGFQLSFLATLGLLVTVPRLTNWLDWLPQSISTALAVPIAAYFWTIPLQLYVFGVLSPYSILLNLLATPLVTLISIGGIFTGMIALIHSGAGSFAASSLTLPVQGLVELVNGFSRLPGSTIAVGTLSLFQVALLYGLLGVAHLDLGRWFSPPKRGSQRDQVNPWQPVIWAGMGVGLGLALLPAWFLAYRSFQFTVLVTSDDPILVIRYQGAVGLVNSGGERTTNLTLKPFLRQQGINHIDWAIATRDRDYSHRGWLQLLDSVPIRQLLIAPAEQPAGKLAGAVPAPAQEEALTPVLITALDEIQSPHETLATGQVLQQRNLQIQVLQAQPVVLHLRLGDQTWLYLEKLDPESQKRLVQLPNLPQADTLWWSGHALLPELIQAVQPQVAIASAWSLTPETIAQFHQAGVTLYWTGRDGAVQWTPHSHFQTVLSSENPVGF